MELIPTYACLHAFNFTVILDCYHVSPVPITSQFFCLRVYRFIGAGLAPSFIPLLWDTLQLISKYISLSVVKTIAIGAVKRKEKSKSYM